jgi:hypothetical protein
MGIREEDDEVTEERRRQERKRKTGEGWERREEKEAHGTWIELDTMAGPEARD